MSIASPPPEVLPSAALSIPMIQTVVREETTTNAPASSWLHTNLRNVLSLGIGVIVGWLAYEGNQQAQAALIAAFTVLVGMIFGERVTLKKPGVDS